jgi:hypothetical protein
MTEELSRNDVATLIRARKILKSRGLAKDVDVKSICEIARISRKTGYQWADNLGQRQDDALKELQGKYECLKAEHEALEKRYDDTRFENEGRKIAWEIHHIDELIAAKKNAAHSQKKGKR